MTENAVCTLLRTTTTTFSKSILYIRYLLFRYSILHHKLIKRDSTHLRDTCNTIKIHANICQFQYTA